MANTARLARRRLTDSQTLSSDTGRDRLLVATGSAMLVVSLLPTFSVPLYQDDLVLETTEYANHRSSLGNVLGTSWNDMPQPNRFTPVSREFQGVYHFVAHSVGRHVTGNPALFYRLGAVVMLLLVLLTAAYLVCAAIQSAELQAWRFAPVYAALSGLTAITMQQHPWLFDPTLVDSYIALPATALGFLVLGSCMLALREPALVTRSAVLLVVTAVVGSLFYETVDAAIAGAGLLMLIRYVNHPDDRARIRWLALGSVALPAVISVLGRVYVSSQHPPAYRGTAFELSGRTLKAGWVLTSNMIPGSAWPNPMRGPGLPEPHLGAAVCSAALIVLGILQMVMLRRIDFPVPTRWRSLRGPLSGLALFVAGSIILLAVTPKYAEMLRQRGSTYTAYSTLLIVSCMLILMALVALTASTWMRSARAWGSLIGVAAVFLVIQTSLNWSLDQYWAEHYDGNRALVRASVDPNLTNDQRCAVWTYFSSSADSADVVAAVAAGVNRSYQIDFGPAFCVPR